MTDSSYRNLSRASSTTTTTTTPTKSPKEYGRNESFASTKHVVWKETHPEEVSSLPLSGSSFSSSYEPFDKTRNSASDSYSGDSWRGGGGGGVIDDKADPKKKPFVVEKLEEKEAGALRSSLLSKSLSSSTEESGWKISVSSAGSIDIGDADLDGSDYNMNADPDDSKHDVNANANNVHGEEWRFNVDSYFPEVDRHVIRKSRRMKSPNEKKVRFHASRVVKVAKGGKTKTVHLTSRVSEGICISGGVVSGIGAVGGAGVSPDVGVDVGISAGGVRRSGKRRGIAKGVSSLSTIYTMKEKR